MKLKDICAYKHQGKRKYEEDNFLYGDNFLLVSDGLGGHVKGNVASGIVTNVFSSCIKDELPAPEHIKNWTTGTVEKTLNELSRYARRNPKYWEMGATLALLLQTENTFVSIHIGDSRIYHFGANGSIKWRSKDHSWVQEQIDMKLITAEQARAHPNCNVITKSLMANDYFSTKAAIHKLKKVKTGDSFLVCSDGVTEAWTDARLSTLMGADYDNKTKIGEIKKYCAKHSDDNNTAVIASV